AGQRMQQLEKEVQELETKQKEASENLTLFTSWCNDLGLEEKHAGDEATYQRIRKEANRKNLELDTKQRNNEEDEYEAKRTREKCDIEKKQIEDELNNLLHSKNNIPVQLINLRKQLCETLNIDNNDLPFCGELMQVKTEYMPWQPALEKLLRSLALRLLVPM